MSPESGEKSAIDRLLDAGVFAPLGFLLTRDKAVADLATAGRKQIAFSRSLGRAALKGFVRAAHTPQQAQPGECDQRGDGAVPDYDTMTARDIVAFVATCDDQQVEWIRTREVEGKNRITVFRALDVRQNK